MSEKQEAETAASVVAEHGSEAATERKKRKKRRRKIEKEQGSPPPNFDIPGVTKIVLSQLTQKVVGCIVGEHVTSEKPWTYIPKETLTDNLELHEESSEFLPVKQEILDFPQNDLLLGYHPDENRDYDEFFICLTETALEEVANIINKLKDDQEKRLNNTIFKTIKHWQTQGSEAEVDDLIIKNHRPLLEVEVESQYPIMKNKVYFTPRRAEDARDGYVELLPGRFPIINVNKRRIDGSAQVAPAVVTNEAQTICRYPQNAWTQYRYDYESTPETKEFKESMKNFMSKQTEEFYDLIRTNGVINLYENDYLKLVTDEKYTKIPETLLAIKYMTFTDINLCKGKTISCFTWHPMISGIIAIGYSDVSANTFRKSAPTIDEVNNTVHGISPVLMWTFKDGLNPKLCLETQRAVMSLSFCPYDENILVGGCDNGQIIVWDIKNRLKHVEEEEVLTNAQQKYRTLMHSLMQWMKNTKDLSLVRPAAVSDIEYSHKASVRGIQWLSAYTKVTKSGQIIEIADEEPTTLQFLTCSEDGTIQFWDLLAKPITQAGAFKAQRRLRRLKKRPSALTIDISPFKILHRNLKPHYKLNLQPSTDPRSVAISAINIPFSDVDYIEVNSTQKKAFESITHRMTFKPNLKRPELPTTYQFVAGSTIGDFLIGHWEGFEFHTGEVVMSETVKFSVCWQFHDGPVTSIGRSKYHPDILLTVGGKVFAVWDQKFLEKPILWRRSRKTYTHGAWNTYRATIIRMCRSDGTLEGWHLLARTDRHVFQQRISGNMITQTSAHPIALNSNICGVADENGSFHLMLVPALFEFQDDNEVILLQKLFTREVQRKTKFLKWQTEWNNKNCASIQRKKDEEEQAHKRREEEELRAKQKMEEEKERSEKEAAKKAAQDARPQPGQFLEWAHSKWNKREEERMSKIILTRKHLNKELLEKQQIPMKKKATEEQFKKKKQSEKLSESADIFHETVSMLFPDTMRKKTLPPPDPYGSGDAISDKLKEYRRYNDILVDCQMFVEQNPHNFNFEWSAVLNTGKNRRQILDGTHDVIIHTARLEEEKHARKVEEERDSLTRVKRVVGPIESTESTDVFADDEASVTDGDESMHNETLED